MPVRGLLRSDVLTVSSTSVGMTVTAAKGFIPNAAEITVEDAAIRYFADGTTPTSTTGKEVEDGGSIILVDRGEVTLFRAIRRDGSDAKLRYDQAIEYIA